MRLRVVLAFATCLLGIVSVSALSAQSVHPQESVSMKELKWLIQNAETAADHQKLAAYYTAQAKHLVKESKKHRELVEIYANRPLWGKTAVPVQLLEHCRELAALEAKAANEAQQMAAIHEEMAKKLPN